MVGHQICNYMGRSLTQGQWATVIGVQDAANVASLPAMALVKAADEAVLVQVFSP
jgi:hypothetical protein